MKTKLLILALAALSFANAIPAGAQIITTTPTGAIAWATDVSACRIVTGANLATIDVWGVFFKPNSYGTIGITCPVPMTLALPVDDVNDFALTFNNTNGFVNGVNECEIIVGMATHAYGSKIIQNDGLFETAGTAYSGVKTANIGLKTVPMNFSTTLYSVGITMTRQTGATCNPSAMSVVLQELFL
jgi:hypothetical protein